MPFFAAVVLAASSKPSTSGSSAISFVILILLFAGAYFLFIRPRSMAARRQRDTLQELNAGDEVLTGAGIFGTVLDVESDRVTLETAPGTRITVLRSAIARRIPPPIEEGDDAWSSGEDDSASSNGPGPTAGAGEHDEHQTEESERGGESQGGVS
jgi:preprotein translocase subunit YajC